MFCIYLYFNSPKKMEIPSLLYLVLFIISLPFSLKFMKRRTKKLNLPPSPTKSPIIGHLNCLGELPHRSFLALSNKYGPLMLLHLGKTPTLVVSSAEISREIMTSHDVVFASRPGGIVPETLLYGRKDIGFAPYGEYWKQVKKFSVSNFLNLKTVESFQFVRDEETTAMINQLCRVEGCSVDLTAMIGGVVNNIISKCVFGRRTGKEGGSKRTLIELAKEGMVLLNTPAFGDMFPLMGWLDYITGLMRRLNETSRGLDAFFNHIIEERLNCPIKEDEKMDFLQVLLQLEKESHTLGLKLTRDNIKAIIMDLILGGTASTWATIEWTMTELSNNPNIMNKLQKEVRKVVGKKPKVEASDINQMNYLECAIKEVMRLHPPFPLLAPRETTQDSTLQGFDIPSKTKVFINAWAIQRDPKYWDRPEEFLPERFEDFPVDFKNPEFRFFPFGGGRRGCPGMVFSLSSIKFLVANLVFWFDWKLPGDNKLDMSETFGIVVAKKYPVHLVPILHSLVA